MHTLLILVCCSSILVNNCVYAQHLHEQIEISKTEILDVILQLSGKIDTVNRKTDNIQKEIVNIQEEMTYMKLMFGSNGLIANELNDKLSLLPTHISNMAVNMGNSITDSVSYEIKELKKDTNLADRVADINSTINQMDQRLSTISIGVQDLAPRRSCADLYKLGRKISGPAQIAPYMHSCNYVPVLCDQDSDGGRWTVIQKRQVVEPREDFQKPWADYAQGFGKLEGGEFWAGLDLLHALSKQGNQELLIELEDWEGEKRWAKYSTFKIGPPEDNYRLTVSGYTGDAGNNMGYHNGMPFSTHDHDNDNWYTESNCASYFGGGWWFKACMNANLNGVPNQGTDTLNSHGILWVRWHGRMYSLKSTTMKIRPSE
ncbi:unnamed protein product [Meganyctiphanes norvegica]|uniref:Fibrinogen C-terminal domain-containing protein n=1 Tax=Meganyctiphanes norvegica TaxID=48144 RepID=A0AAV2SJB4_MEGNR